LSSFDIRRIQSLRGALRQLTRHGACQHAASPPTVGSIVRIIRLHLLFFLRPRDRCYRPFAARWIIVDCAGLRFCPYRRKGRSGEVGNVRTGWRLVRGVGKFKWATARKISKRSFHSNPPRVPELLNIDEVR